MWRGLSLATMMALLFFSVAAQAVYSIGDQVTDDFTLQDVYGETHSLFDYYGHCVLINFFATW